MTTAAAAAEEAVRVASREQTPPHQQKASHISHWPLPLRFALLNLGLVLYGIALSAMIQADVGLAPWDALHVGMTKAIAAPWFSVGLASISVGFVLQAVALLLLGMRIGVGSALNMVLIGVYIDLFLPRLPAPREEWGAWLLFLGGILGVGLATGAYIASGFGAGPRDSVVIGLNRKTGWPVKYLRSGIELLVLLTGWSMGAKVGWGTLAFALLIGPSMSTGMGLFGLKR